MGPALRVADGVSDSAATVPEVDVRVPEQDGLAVPEGVGLSVAVADGVQAGVGDAVAAGAVTVDTPETDAVPDGVAVGPAVRGLVRVGLALDIRVSTRAEDELRVPVVDGLHVRDRVDRVLQDGAAVPDDVHPVAVSSLVRVPLPEEVVVGAEVPVRVSEAVREGVAVGTGVPVRGLVRVQLVVGVSVGMAVGVPDALPVHV